MRGVNLSVFDFDYDLTWMAFLMNADEQIYGRYGGRDVTSSEKYLTLTGLRYAMQQALATHRRAPKVQPPTGTRPVRTVEQYPAAGRLKPGACIHCHQVYDFRREALVAEGKWRQDEVWVYPLPDNLGLTLDAEQGDRVRVVADGSTASRAGLRAGDLLRSLNGNAVASFGDAQYALHHAPAQGKIAVTWQRGDQTLTGTLELAGGWRRTDISWRGSMWGLEPVPGVYGYDLEPEEKQSLGLSAKALAFRQGAYVPPQAKAVGIKANDIILGIDNKPLEMTMLQFNAYIRLNYQVGDKITFNILRNGERLQVPMTLSKRPTG
jgi:hypothetical protein